MTLAAQNSEAGPVCFGPAPQSNQRVGSQPTSYVNTLGQDLTKFNLELLPEWLMLQTHKWRRPKWVKFPRWLHEDARWINLSDRAKAAWPSILVIASENPSSKLPNPDVLYRRLREVGASPRRDSFSALIDELIQCGFILKATPELQSYRDTELQIKKEIKERNGFRTERGSGEQEEMKTPGREYFVEVDTPEWVAWSKVRHWPEKDFKVDGRYKRGWWFRSAWPSSELKPKINGGSAPVRPGTA